MDAHRHRHLGESAEVQGIATAVWTEEVKAAQRAANEANEVLG